MRFIRVRATPEAGGSCISRGCRIATGKRVGSGLWITGGIFLLIRIYSIIEICYLLLLRYLIVSPGGFVIACLIPLVNTMIYLTPRVPLLLSSGLLCLDKFSLSRNRCFFQECLDVEYWKEEVILSNSPQVSNISRNLSKLWLPVWINQLFLSFCQQRGNIPWRYAYEYTSPYSLYFLLCNTDLKSIAIFHYLFWEVSLSVPLE